jgi:hypothetical protein
MSGLPAIQTEAATGKAKELPVEAPLPKFLAASGYKGMVYREPYGVALIILTAGGTRWQYTHGVADPESIPPESYILDTALFERPGNIAGRPAECRRFRKNPEVTGNLWKEV